MADLLGEVTEGQNVTVKLTTEKQETPTGKAELDSVIQNKKDDVLYTGCGHSLLGKVGAY